MLAQGDVDAVAQQFGPVECLQRCHGGAAPRNVSRIVGTVYTPPGPVNALRSPVDALPAGFQGEGMGDDFSALRSILPTAVFGRLPIKRNSDGIL